MNLSHYQDALAKLPVAKLTDFLKANADLVVIDDWNKLRAPEKRDTMMQAFEQSKEIRIAFVPFFAEVMGTEADFSEWETTDLTGQPTAETDAGTPPDEADEAPVADTHDMSEHPDSADQAADAAITAETFTLTPDAEILPPEEATPAPTKGKGKGKAKADDTPAPTPAPTPALAGLTPIFVEGAFENIVADVAGLDANASRVNLRESQDRLEFESIRVGALLAHIRDSQHYVTLGYDSIREFIAGETALDYRKAAYLISNFTAVKTLGIPPAKLQGVTWSALRHVIPVLKADNYAKWLGAARTTPHLKLIEMVRKEIEKEAAKALPPATAEGQEQAPAPIPMVSKKFDLYPEQDGTLKAALDKAKAAANVDSNGAALDIIASAYIGAPIAETTALAAPHDFSPDGLRNFVSKLKATKGDGGLMDLMNAIGDSYSDVDIAVAFPEPTATAAE